MDDRNRDYYRVGHRPTWADPAAIVFFVTIH